MRYGVLRFWDVPECSGQLELLQDEDERKIILFVSLVLQETTAEACEPKRRWERSYWHS